MKIVILTLGTRGDLELFALLARTLAERGHQARLVTSRFYESRVAGLAGMECTCVGKTSATDLESLLTSLGAITDLRTRTLAYVDRFVRPELAAASPLLEQLAGDADYFVSNLKITIARNGQMLPTAFVTYDPPAAMEELDRYSANLPRERILELVAFPRKLIDPESRWPQRYRFTGFWLSKDTSSTLPAVVQDFLTSGTPPVVLTAGSMRMLDPKRIAGTFSEAVTQSGKRGIIVNSPQVTTDGSVLHAGEIPYAALFPHAAAIVQHGGVGTVAETLRAGKPAIVMPQILAQRHMGELLVKAGVSPATLDPATVTAQQLAAAIHDAATNTRYCQSAAALRGMIAQDAGIITAAAAIEAHWGSIAKP